MAGRGSANVLLVCVVGLAQPALVAAGEQGNGPFAADVNTLFLAHFDQQTDAADYALGVSLFCGNGARSTAGYYGRGLDLRPRGLTPNFMTACADYTPRYDGWGFHARGNVDPTQGTLECWVQVDDPQRKAAWSGAPFLDASLQRAVPHPAKPKEMYASFQVGLSVSSLSYSLPTVAGGCFIGEVKLKSVKGFARALAPADWHHFALTWSQGETVLWFDGRAVTALDMTGQLGLVALDNPVRYLGMSNCVLDELRISNCVRYTTDFEPRWRDGRRPDYAFPGAAGLRRYEPRLLPTVVAEHRPLTAPIDPVEERFDDQHTLRFDRTTGALYGVWSAEGLVLHEGLERRPLRPRRVRNYYRQGDLLGFTQEFEGQIEVVHRIAARGPVLAWQVTLTNRREKQEAWLEPLLGVECPLGQVTEIFDGCEARRTVSLPRHRDEYCLTLPFAAASDGKRFFGIGTDPHADLNDIVTEWVPAGRGGVIRQGTKLALAPGESYRLPFYVVRGPAEFETLDAIAAFHACFPDLYALRSDVPVYSYMPATQVLTADGAADFKRLGYAGGVWGHGPGHDKGDEFGRAEWWDNPKLYENREYQSYTRRIESVWGTLDNLRECITYYHRECFDNLYPMRRFHTCPDLTPNYIVASLWPGYRPNEDPLCFGQYYLPITNWWIVNEYNTPIGAFFRQTTREYLRQTHGFCVGFINDMSHAGALYRHNDPIAQRSPGRSFSRDLGTFVRKAVGRKQRYEVANQFVDGGQRSSFWSDGGAFSYTLCAYSAAIAIEGGAMYRDLTGPGNYAVPARNLLGEKPLTAMTHMNDDWTGRFLRPDEFTPSSLRDYYRFCDSQLTLFCLQHGMTLDPSSYMFGRQISLERAPLMVESAVLGRKLVPAARVKAPLWVRRSGDGLRTLLVVGNSQPTPCDTSLELVNRYYGGAPIVVSYYGGAAEHGIDQEKTTVAAIRVPPRDVQAFKTAALLESAGPAQATSRFEGDGLRLRIMIDVAAPPESRLWLSDFGPLYRIAQIEVDGRPIRALPDEPIAVAQNHVVATYANRALEFTADQWRAVELIKEGATNFCLVADKGLTHTIPGAHPHTFPIGFERGTAAMLNDFLAQYDSEDGVPDNLQPAPFVTERPEGFAGWVVRLQEDGQTPAGRVRIDAARKELRVAGPTQGEIRRAMVVLLRMLDRKYPHVGRFFPLRMGKTRYQPGQPPPFDKWVERADTRKFFQNFTADPLFLAKPILRAEYESLYKDDNMDFAGRYALRASPYLFEPTYGDDFVYGYSGPGKATPREELQRAATPVGKAAAKK